MSAIHESGLDELSCEQETYYSLLASRERPGTVTQLPPTRTVAPYPWPAAVVQVARALIEPGDGFAVHGENAEAIAPFIASLTGALHRPAYAAGYVLAYPYTEEPDVWSLPRIMLAVPGQGSTLVVACRLLAEPGPGAATEDAVERGVVLALSGPGIPWQRVVIVDATAADFLLAFATMQDDGSPGVDVVLVDAAGQVAVLRKTTCCQPMGSVDGVMTTLRQKDAPLAAM